MDNRKINILFILPSLCIGGAQRQVIDLVNGISGDKFRINLLTFEKHLDYLNILDREKVRFYNFPRKYKYDFTVIHKIAKIIDKEDIDIIHCTNQIAILFGFLGKLIAKKKTKFIGAIHATINRNFKNELFDWFLYTPLMIFCEAIITVCQNQRIHWSRKYPFLKKKFITIHNGIDFKKFSDITSFEEKEELKSYLGLKNNEFIVAILSALRPEKGHSYAFKALKEILKNEVKIKLLIIGDGERKAYLQSLAKELSISKYVVWLGWQKDPRQFIGISDILLLPSTAETFSIAILESLSMGKPVITTDIGGASEMVLDGLNGFLIKPKDVCSIEKVLKELLNDKGLVKNLSATSRKSVIQKFSIEKMCRKTENLFVEIVSSGTS